MTALYDEILMLTPPDEAIGEQYACGYVDALDDAAELVAKREERQPPDPIIGPASTFRNLWNFDFAHIGVEEFAAGVQLRIYSRMHERWFELPLATCSEQVPPPLVEDES